MTGAPCTPTLPCSASTPRLVVFNRVPKCGSSSLEAIIKRQATVERRFSFLRDKDFVNNSLDDAEQSLFARTLTDAAKSRTRTLYDRHVLYVDFASFGLPRPVYINLLRDPLRMQVSAFYFWRQCICATRQGFCSIAMATNPQSRAALCRADYTIDTLYANMSVRPTVGLMTRWFCGHGKACGGVASHRDPYHQPPLVSRRVRDEALRRALDNLRNQYLWVGVLERLEDSLRLLTKLLPGYFGRLVVERAAREHVRPRSNSSYYTYSMPNAATLEKLRVESENDLKVYDEAVRILDCRLAGCGLHAAPKLAPAAAAPSTPSAPADAGPIVTANRAAEYLLRKRHHRHDSEKA